MARASWLVDSNRIASKIRSASAPPDQEVINWTSNPTRTCPNCQYIIDNTEVAQEWPGLPRGVKFDPSDQEIIWHLLGKAGVDNLKPHPFLDEFIPTVNEDDGICYTHPRNLPGVKQDGSVSHFFHRAIKAYNTGTRKRRKIHGASSGDVRWHKTGRTKPVLLDGIQKGCKKIMVLYLSPAKGGKPEKTNWVMHQYHLGIEEDEKDGEYVISKVFYQQLQIKQSDKNDAVEDDAMVVKVDPVTPKSVTPKSVTLSPAQHNEAVDMEEQFGSPLNEQPMFPLNEQQPITALMEQPNSPPNEEIDCADLSLAEGFAEKEEEEAKVDNDNNKDDNEANGEERKWWDSESQYMLDSQQLVEALSLCDEFLQSQSSQKSPTRDGNGNVQGKNKARLSDYAQLGPEHLKKDLEECQNLVMDPANLELDTPPTDFRLSQLEFGSQDSFISWGGSKGFDAGDQDSSK